MPMYFSEDEAVVASVPPPALYTASFDCALLRKCRSAFSVSFSCGLVDMPADRSMTFCLPMVSMAPKNACPSGKRWLNVSTSPPACLSPDA